MADHADVPDARTLLAATDRRGIGPLRWAAAPLAQASRVLGIGPCAADLGAELTATYVSVGPVENGTSLPTVRADPARLPMRTNAVDGLCVLLALAASTDLDERFAEIRRVLRPGGTLVVLTPSASPRSPSELMLRSVHRAGWANRSALDGAGWLLAAADFAVLSDDRLGFTVAVPDGLAAGALATALPAAGAWPPVKPAPSTIARLQSVAGPGGRWPIPMRRLVARR